MYSIENALSPQSYYEMETVLSTDKLPTIT